MLRYAAAVLLAAAVAFAFSPLTIKLARRLNIVARESERTIHKGEIPRIGGLAILAGLLAGLLALGDFSGQIRALILGALIIAFLGFWDDARDLKPIAKLCGQVIAALIAIQGGIVVEFFTNPFNGHLVSLGVFSVPLTVLWLVGVSNAINLIDGMDGLSPGVCTIAALTIGIIGLIEGPALGGPFVGVVAFVLAGAILGFLPFNFPPAKTFMGDCGALSLGFLLGCLSIMGVAKSATVISLFIPVLILGFPILDTFGAIIRRFTSGRPVFQADRGHLHHRLLARGLSQRRALLVIYVLTCLLGLAAILMSILTTPQAAVILIIVTALLTALAKKLGVFKPVPAKLPQGERMPTK